MNKHSRVYASVDLEAVRHNFSLMHQAIRDDVKIVAVIKTDAYGHGAVSIAHLVEPFDYIWGFAVAAVEEAVQLRESGIKKPILILGFTFPEDYQKLVELDIRPAVFKLSMAEQLSAAALAAGKDIAIHLALDTGMTRIGFPDTQESAEVIRKIAALPGIHIEGMFTHFARADETDKTYAKEQLRRYLTFAGLLQEKGVDIPLKHCSNSAGIMELPEANLDMVRAGITTYGIYPSDEMDRERMVLAPVMELKSHIAYIKTVQAGVPVSYGGTYVTDREMRIATIPVGYGDGYPRSLSNNGYVLIRGQKAPILGRVCMDQFMVDVTDIEAEEFDEVTLMGKDGEAEITVDELGALSGRFPYEFVCDIGKRIPRVYKGLSLDE